MLELGYDAVEGLFKRQAKKDTGIRKEVHPSNQSG
jgi:hypothetical protein